MNHLKKEITILYANRNRDVDRIKVSLDTLNNQTVKNFEVIFVDYGSQPTKLVELKKALNNYIFVRFYSLEVPQVLWNKSKALNYGIKKTNTEFVFIADVDLIFHPETLDVLQNLKNFQKFSLFSLGYLNQKESIKLKDKFDFKALNPSRFGEVNGMILVSTVALKKINGLDEFFHFYGSEDEDLFARLENAGVIRENVKKCFFYHNWHQSFSGSEDNLLTAIPRVKNIMRINQHHYLRNKESGVTKPARQEEMGVIIDKKRSGLLDKPDLVISVLNILAQVEHFFGEELPIYKNKVVKIEFQEDPYYKTVKYSIKKLLGKQTQLYCSMKEVNDIILKEILFRYRDFNYSYNISKDQKLITFCIEL